MIQLANAVICSSNTSLKMAEKGRNVYMLIYFCTQLLCSWWNKHVKLNEVVNLSGYLRS